MLCLILILFIFIFPFPVGAQSPQFKTDLTTEYIFSASGSSVVRENFSVTNLTSRYLTSDYEFIINGEVPNHLTATDNHGSLEIRTENINLFQNKIRVLFDRVPAGKNRTWSFTLSYEGPFTSLSKNVRKIIIPRLSHPGNLDNYSVKLIIPRKFGDLIYNKPDTYLSENDYKTGLNTYIFTNKQIAADGITVVFGNFRIEKYFLGYRITNSENYPVISSLLLPCQTADQKIFINSIEPHPLKLFRDNFGDWVAVYQLSPKSDLMVNVIGQAYLSPSQKELTYHYSGVNFNSDFRSPFKTVTLPGLYLESGEQLNINWHPPLQIFPFIKNSGFIEISNQGSEAYSLANLSVSAVGFSLFPGNYSDILVLPLATVKIPLVFKADIRDLLYHKYLSITAGDTSVTYNIPYNLFLISYGFITLVFTIAFLGTATFTHRAWGLYLQKFLRKGNLRR